jgi:hypothetical protein
VSLQKPTSSALPNLLFKRVWIGIVFLVFISLQARSQNTFPASGSAGIGTTNPRALLDIATPVGNGALGSVLVRQTEGDGQGSGTNLGVRAWETQWGNGGKSISLDQSFYGTLNSAFNFYRGRSFTGGYMSFATGTGVERMTIDNNGNVGIGTAAPTARLHIVGLTRQALWISDGSERYLSIGQGTGAAIIDPIGSGAMYLGYDSPSDIYFGGSSANGIWKGNGNVGIGTINPISKFQISGGNASQMTLGSNTGILFSVVKNDEGYGMYAGVSGSGDTWIQAGRTSSPMAYNLNLQASGGNVGIGTTSPSEKLSVNGNIKAQKLIITQNGWADYVFKTSYKLRPLNEVELFIKANQHLPDVPSEKEISNNGVDVGDAQAILLKKIEELTLYILEQNKKIGELALKVKKMSR